MRPSVDLPEPDGPSMTTIEGRDMRRNTVGILALFMSIWSRGNLWTGQFGPLKLTKKSNHPQLFTAGDCPLSWQGVPLLNLLPAEPFRYRFLNATVSDFGFPSSRSAARSARDFATTSPRLPSPVHACAKNKWFP